MLIEDPGRLDGVAVIGVDEHCWRHTRRGDRFVTVVIDLTPSATAPARLGSSARLGSGSARLGSAAGHGRRPLQPGVQDLAGAADQAWRDAVDVVAMEGFTGFKTATTEELPDATAVMEPITIRCRGCADVGGVVPDQGRVRGVRAAMSEPGEEREQGVGGLASSGAYAGGPGAVHGFLFGGQVGVQVDRGGSGALVAQLESDDAGVHAGEQQTIAAVCRGTWRVTFLPANVGHTAAAAAVCRSRRAASASALIRMPVRVGNGTVVAGSSPAEVVGQGGDGLPVQRCAAVLAAWQRRCAPVPRWMSARVSPVSSEARSPVLTATWMMARCAARFGWPGRAASRAATSVSSSQAMSLRRGRFTVGMANTEAIVSACSGCRYSPQSPRHRRRTVQAARWPGC